MTLEGQEPLLATASDGNTDHNSPVEFPCIQETRVSVRQQWVESFGLVTQKRYRRSWILGVGVPVVGRLCGIDIFSAYTTTIFEDAGFKHAIIGSILFGFTDFVASAIPVFFLDRLGRLRTAEISFSGVAVCHIGLAISGLLRNAVAGPLAVMSALLFMLFYGAGAGTLNKTYAPEVVPSEIARIVLGTGQCVATLSALGQVLVFPSLLDALGAAWYFFLHGSFVFASLLFLRIFMIETKGRELEDVVAEVTRSNEY